jgi:hypothetical protein
VTADGTGIGTSSPGSEAETGGKASYASETPARASETPAGGQATGRTTFGMLSAMSTASPSTPALTAKATW